MSTPLIVLITAPVDEAEELAEALVERQLVACANLLPPMQSIFRWEGAVTNESECLLLCKTSEAAYSALEAALPELHPYDVPELLAFPAQHALAEYAQWVADATRHAS